MNSLRWAHTPENVSFVDLQFSDLIATHGATTNISKSGFNCFNLGGIDFHGERFNREYGVRSGSVGAMWVGVDIPAQANVVGLYASTLTLKSSGQDLNLKLVLTVEMPQNGTPLLDHGN